MIDKFIDSDIMDNGLNSQVTLRQNSMMKSEYIYKKLRFTYNTDDFLFCNHEWI